jgi:membrane-associated phospholipid phosphatase
MDMKALIHQFDQRVTAGIVQLFGPQLRPFFEFVTALGDPITVFVVAGALAIVAAAQSSMRLFLTAGMIPLTLLVGSLLKMLFERARPLTEYAMDMRLQTYSFPSGHSSGSMITFGILAYIAYMKLPAPWNLIVAVVLMVLPLLIGISRVYLGAHFPSDVIAGWLLGLVMLALVVFVIRPFN